jgi:8-oxo-dGTP pyrophosphatase MutT (NUDIX family)/N-acetylglutamate synthase-like GNAT family acetyltransferase
MTQEFDETGWKLVQKSFSQKRSHDVTMLIEGIDGRFAVMSKHSYPPGIYRSPSGGVNPGEDLLTGALREAKEETGLDIDLKRFLLHITLDIGHEGEAITWDSYIFHATTEDVELNPTDLKEVKDTRWATRAQLEALAEKLKETGNGGYIYRGNLTAGSLWALNNEFTIREGAPKDLPGIEMSLQANRLNASRIGDTLWWIAEINGLTAGTVGITPHEDCAELSGLTTEPLYRGRGLGHAMVEYACEQWFNPEQRKKFAAKGHVILNDKLWLLTPIPGYFLCVNFALANKGPLPATLRQKLTGSLARWSGMRYQPYQP